MSLSSIKVNNTQLNWDEEPIAGSDNLVKSDGVADAITLLGLTDNYKLNKYITETIFTPPSNTAYSKIYLSVGYHAASSSSYINALRLSFYASDDTIINSVYFFNETFSTLEEALAYDFPNGILRNNNRYILFNSENIQNIHTGQISGLIIKPHDAEHNPNIYNKIQQEEIDSLPTNILSTCGTELTPDSVINKYCREIVYTPTNQATTQLEIVFSIAYLYTDERFYNTIRVREKDADGQSLTTRDFFSNNYATEGEALSNLPYDIIEKSFGKLLLSTYKFNNGYGQHIYTPNHPLTYNYAPCLQNLIQDGLISRLEGNIDSVVEDINDTTETVYNFGQTGECYLFTIGQSPELSSVSKYKVLKIDGLEEGNVVKIHARSGTSKKFFAKCLNDLVIEIQDTLIVSDYDVVCDGTFDSLYINDYTDYISTPSAKLLIKTLKFDQINATLNKKTNDAIPNEYSQLTVIQTYDDCYLKRTDGTTPSATNFQVKKFAVEPFATYYLTGSTGAGTGSCFAAFYNSNDAFISSSVIKPANEYPSTVWYRLKVTAPSDAAYIRVERHATPDVAVEIVSGYASVYNNVEELIRSNFGNVLHGKKWVVCGDSNTNGDFTGYSGQTTFIDGPFIGQKMVYPRFIAERNSMELVLDAVNGSIMGLSKAYVDDPDNVDINTRYPFSYQRYLSVPLDADYITLWFGGNDVSSIEYTGTIEDETNTTLCGAWNIVLRYFITNAPFAKIGIIVPYTSNAEIREVVRNVAKKWGIPYLDMAGDAQVPFMNLKESSLGVTSEVGTLRKNAYRVSETNGHMNPLAHKYQSTFIEYWLRSL